MHAGQAAQVLWVLSNVALVPTWLQDDGKARALLRRMGDASVRAAVLEQLGAFDPDRAAACFALLGDEADEYEEEADEWEDASDDERQQPSAGQQQQQQGQGGEDAAAAEHVEEARSAQRARSRRAAAAGARRAVKRAASAALSDSEATESEAEPSRCVLFVSAAEVRVCQHGQGSLYARPTTVLAACCRKLRLPSMWRFPAPPRACSDEEMREAGSSDDDEFVAPRSSRRGRVGGAPGLPMS